MAAGRMFVSGSSAARADGAMEDAKLMGIDLAEDDLPGQEAIWEWHLPALDAFRRVATQWRVAGTMERVVRTGLDYGACFSTWTALGMEMTETLFDEVQVIERGALKGMQERAG